ncbi:MAG TPA: hypothetical protein VFX60_08730 [Micromonospora sp.]|nr:hypothetical protein [Micromonospora sp.]
MNDLPEDAAAFDAGVVDAGLRYHEQEWLERQLCDLQRSLRTAERSSDDDLQVLIARHSVSVDAQQWAAVITWLPPHLGSTGPANLSRGDVINAADQCRMTGDWLPLLVTSFVWGQGDLGYGPTRLSWVLDGKQGRPAPTLDDIRHRLAQAVFVLARDGAAAAYDLLIERGSIPELGPAFFTKFLYFAGKTGDVAGPQPMILDKRLAGRMRWFWERRRDEPYAAQARPPEWLWRGPRWSTYRYRIYLAFLSRSAEQLAQSGQRWTPDLVEMLLFRRDPVAELGRA